MSLRETLDHMLHAAAEHPGQPQRRPLPHGLLVQVKIEDGVTTLGISRADKLPSLTEWRTILDYLPYPINVQPKTGINKDGRYGLYASWKTPEE